MQRSGSHVRATSHFFMTLFAFIFDIEELERISFLKIKVVRNMRYFYVWLVYLLIYSVLSTLRFVVKLEHLSMRRKCIVSPNHRVGEECVQLSQESKTGRESLAIKNISWFWRRDQSESFSDRIRGIIESQFENPSQERKPNVFTYEKKLCAFPKRAMLWKNVCVFPRIQKIEKT